MENTIRINNEITVGPQPTEDDIRDLAKQGFQTIINLRHEGEDDMRLRPDEEGEMVQAAGMDYRNIPVSMKDASERTVDLFRTELNSVPRPVFVHCAKGKRAGAFTMMHEACSRGMSGDETLKKAEEMGFECENEKLEQFVKQYVDSHGVGA